MMNHVQNPNGRCEDAPCCGCCGVEYGTEFGDDMSEFEGDETPCEDGEPQGSFDCSDEAEALASAGYGTDEDYGCYGGEDSFLDGYYESQTECDFGE
jgi:hypothetical protein